jgi:uncharacterized protein YbjT (DUF2867 family)
MTLSNPTSRQPILVLGGTGKTGRRIVDRLQARHWPVRIGSRSASPRFDWEDRGSWAPALAGIGAVYLSYTPDLAAPGAPEAIAAFVELAQTQGVHKLVLLSGRGEQEAQRCERIVQQSGLAWTIVRCGWFNQNFSENFIHDMILTGAVTLPATEVREPFIDAEDIADVAVAALTEAGHDGQMYELTGPELITFPEAVATIATAAGRDIAYHPISRETFIGGLTQQQLPQGLVGLLDYLFTTVLDGRNAYLADGVQRALGREPRSFTTYAEGVAAGGHWGIG